ncbi:PIG-L deacetylase family protein [Nocardia brasiliensis]|uniref:LmbE family protein n=1 Tax=Nocardia brasiliensis (strain ATCC 700358 / HUJEG-1) TaxID=1133849 RepID=K0F6A6_NOCB7|nr:PIG-L family deacetylase [Nocardia brasiliensis]AFU02976.1 hypothetical protein O3I_025125 [Nocardia brasiliensis ATCC 700358]OCF86043.1 hypothetical protein AW168_33335 [Nocardia brasiliensis]
MSVQRFAAADLTAPGTTVETWTPWLEQLPAIDPLTLVDTPHLQIVAPHPDDEVLGTGALTALLTDHGVHASIIAVTDGEASHPNSPTHSPADLAALRRRESAAAATELGVAEVVSLGLPDGAVTVHTARLTDLLTDHIRPAATVAIPLHNDGHPDHEATARSACTAAARRGARVLEYPVWMWHWAAPADPDIDWPRARRLILPEECVRRKRRATALFASQIHALSDHADDAAVLAPHIVARLLTLNEVVFV